MAKKYYDVTFTPAVLDAQERWYGRSRPAGDAPARDRLGQHEQAFIALRDSFYMATVSEDGWPYIQHRGGAPGFLRVVDDATLTFADYQGNHQMITVGNLSRNDRVSLFLMDYPNRTRLKVLGHARVEDAALYPDLARQLAAPAEGAEVERLVTIDVVAFDWNCPRHITPRWSADQIESALVPVHAEIADLRAQLKEARESAAAKRTPTTNED